MVSKYSASSNKYHEMLRQLRDYMQFKKLPENMMKHIICYFNFRFQRNFFKEDEILGTLSHKLIDEINIQTCERLLDNVTIFKGLPFSIVLKLTERMTAEIFLPNEVIVKAGTLGDAMYFISSGKVAVYSSGGKEVRNFLLLFVISSSTCWFRYFCKYIGIHLNISMFFWFL